MIKKVLLTFVLISSLTTFAQRDQKIGYVDMEYILENIPEYAQAQNQLDQKVAKWKNTLNQLRGEIETLRADLSNEKALLTEDLISEREEDIYLKEVDLKNLEAAYFSSDGSLFKFRKQLVKPIQDKVYNAAQTIGKARKYDIIFDKSSDVIMIYTNSKADISELVLKSIVRTEKTDSAKEKRAEKEGTSQTKELSEEAQKKIDDRDAKREALIEKADLAKAAKLKKREEQKAEIEKIRLERLKKREEIRNKLKENKENSEEENKENE